MRNPVPVLADFSRWRGITFPLLSDTGSAVIKQYGILNTTGVPVRTPRLGKSSERRHLSTTFTGLRFQNPFLLSSAPPTESDANIVRAFDAGWGGVVTKTIGIHPVVNMLGPKTKFLRADADSPRLSMNKRPGAALHSS